MNTQKQLQEIHLAVSQQLEILNFMVTRIGIIETTLLPMAKYYPELFNQGSTEVQEMRDRMMEQAQKFVEIFGKAMPPACGGPNTINPTDLFGPN